MLLSVSMCDSVQQTGIYLGLLAGKPYHFFILIHVQRFPINIKSLTVSRSVSSLKYNNSPLAMFALNIVSKSGFSLFCYNMTCVVHKKGKLNRTIKRCVSKQIQCSVASPCADKFDIWVEVSKHTISYHQTQKSRNHNGCQLFRTITLLPSPLIAGDGTSFFTWTVMLTPDFLRDHLSGHINGANIRKKLSINRSLEDLAWNCSNVYGSQCVISSSYVREYSVTVGFA